MVILVLCFAIWIGPGNASPETLMENYHLMRESKFATNAQEIPAGGIGWQRDAVSIVLETGKIYFMQPTVTGQIPGLIFEGQGSFQLALPDPWEEENFERLSGKPVAGRIEEPFTRLLLRSAKPLWGESLKPSGDAVFQVNKWAANRHDDYVFFSFEDVDARITCALGIPDDEYWMAEMETASFGWLRFSFDLQAQEELVLEKYQARNDFAEVWVSLDLDRDEAGRPVSAERNQIRIPKMELEADLSKADARLKNSFSTIAVAFKARLTIISLQEELSVLGLILTPWAQVTAVTGSGGEPLDFIRDSFGRRVSKLDKELHDDSLVILLPEALSPGNTTTVIVEYTLKLPNYASGLSWYPFPANDNFTGVEARVTFHHPRKTEVRSVGKVVEQREKGSGTVSVWETTGTTKMLGFTLGRGFKEEPIKAAGLPEIVSFGLESGFTTGNMVRNVAVDVAASLEYFQWLFQKKLPVQRLFASRIDAFHGQAFEGFLHLSRYTYDSEHPGHSELFRAHEVAHQYWGHLVGWNSYRDQWLSESFAEYSAMMFLQQTMPQSGFFEDILDSYQAALIGRSTQNKFARPWMQTIPPKERARMGSIALGSRANTAGYPGAYVTQAYIKGPVVLHMIRMLLTHLTGNPHLFQSVLVDFVNQFEGKKATTRDFQSILEARTQSSWQTFFDQWIYGKGIPRLKWDYKVEPNSGGGYSVALTVDKDRVPGDFVVVVPVRIEFGDKSTQSLLMVMNDRETNLSFDVPQKPTRIAFNADHTALADIQKR